MFPLNSRAIRLPMLLQSEMSDCGIAALAMILGHFGCHIKASEIKNKLPGSLQRGMTVRDIADVANGYGLTARVIKVDASELMGVDNPLILHWEFDHFVVYAGSTEKSVMIHDPAVGRRTVSWKDFTRSFTGVAIDFEAGDSFKKLKAGPTLGYWDVFQWGQGSRSLLGKLIAYSVGFQILAISSPFLLRTAVDSLIVQNNQDMYAVFLAIILFLGAFEVLFSHLKSFMTQAAKIWLEINLSKAFMDKIFRICPSFFESRFIGEIVSRFYSTRDVARIMSDEVPKIVLNVLSLATNFILLCFFSGTLALLLCCLTALTVSASLFYGRQKNLGINSFVTASAKERSTFIETIQQISAIRLSAFEQKKYGQWLNEFSLSINQLRSLFHLEDLWNLGESIVLIGLRILVLMYTLHLALEGELSLGDFLAIHLFVAMFTDAMRGLCQGIARLKGESAHLQRIDDIIGAPDRPMAIPQPNLRPQLSGRIELKAIGFCYDEREEFLFQDLSFTVRPGECVVITGKSGFGKTTLLKCMLGVYPVSRGGIYYDGVHLGKLGMETITQNSAVYLQNQRVFAASIIDNITMYEADYDEMRVEEILRAVGLHETIMAMPMKMDTNALFTLSGGQAQRVLIARAIYKKPRILFFDEATNQLDRDTEIRIANYLKSQADITKIMVAHRQETIDLADRVIDLNQYQRSTKGENP